MLAITPLRLRGASLIELVAVLSIAVVALGASLPLFGDVRASLQQRATINHWIETLAQARLGAVERGNNVVACPSDGDRCMATSYWQDGWMLFEDGDHDGQRSAGEPILLTTPADAHVRIATNEGRHRIRYRFDGTSEGSNATVTFCDKRGPRKARTLVINNAGRVRSGAASSLQAAHACAAG
ncbi:GspH/FimT family pseudopilin [Tahibacter caeni]|uniref:GspH/FimT family pseudopilin n=1 Tax=Tahibacter caeni TaxID=1453545 RepID=UPI0021477F40|nr:GspH/FimT family pseudopilin [Tahibacter caeni]